MDFVASLCDQFARAPEPFTPGEPHFWDDPHVSASMLAAHLDPDTEAASRRPETISRSVEWIACQLGLKPGDAALDLGCGPGLYASRFAGAGFRVTGVDLSPRSIAYARAQDPDNDYRVLDYVETFDLGRFDAVLLIYGDYCVLPPDKRRSLVANVIQALKPGGRFVFDVSTRAHRRRVGVHNRWSAENGGFWRPGPHLVLQHGFDYPKSDLWLDQYVVVEPDGAVSIYRNWFQDYTLDTVIAEVNAHCLVVEGAWSDLAGTPYREDSEWIGLVCRSAN